ncbi:MAG TPA: hypothetical protein VFU57_02410 [Candidatus Acidoferrales bacterium]|nr:hypothetical protein [Candidatus Acidoferrales bacterium]
MPAVNLFSMGYALVGLALALVILYFAAMALLQSFFIPKAAIVTRYESPADVSPGVAAWLLERGKLPRAVASAIVSMAAKSYVKIEQHGDLYSVTQLGPDVSLDLTPEEDALARTLFKRYDCFDFDEPGPQLREAIDAFERALMNTTYFSKHILLSVPAWILSGAGIIGALIQGNFLVRREGPALDPRLIGLLILAFGSFIAAVRSLPDMFEKIAARWPGSTAPKRPWSGSDTVTFSLLVAGIGGVALLALMSTYQAAVFAACFLAVNAIFYHALQGPTSAGKKALARLAEYKIFLARTAADRISRMNACTTVPPELTAENAYAIAFHLDLGWGEQFVGDVSSLVERAEILGKMVKEPAP